MSTDPAAPRSRRALLAAAAAAGGAIVASAAIPAAALAADPNDVVKGTDNATTTTTSITDSGADSTAFAGHATGTGTGSGVEGTSAGGVGVFAWSVSAPPDGWLDPSWLPFTGTYSYAPQHTDPALLAVGVWGDSPDSGVYGSGTYGVTGYGGVGVTGIANESAGAVGVYAIAPSSAQYAVWATGKVHMTRSGRVVMSTGQSSKTVSLAGTTTNSKVFAVLATSETGRYVRAVVPAAGSFKIYLNTTLTSSAVVAWFVLD